MDLMAELERIARERYDGHFAVLRFTTNWRVCFTTPETSMMHGNVTGMAAGNTFEEAAQAAIDFEANNPRGWWKRLDEASEETEARTEALLATPSSGCVFCDMKLLPTNCTDGWQHLLQGGGAVLCAIKN